MFLLKCEYDVRTEFQTIALDCFDKPAIPPQINESKSNSKISINWWYLKMFNYLNDRSRNEITNSAATIFALVIVYIWKDMHLKFDGTNRRRNISIHLLHSFIIFERKKNLFGMFYGIIVNDTSITISIELVHSLEKMRWW